MEQTSQRPFTVWVLLGAYKHWTVKPDGFAAVQNLAQSKCQEVDVEHCGSRSCCSVNVVQNRRWFQFGSNHLPAPVVCSKGQLGLWVLSLAVSFLSSCFFFFGLVVVAMFCEPTLSDPCTG